MQTLGLAPVPDRSTPPPGAPPAASRAPSPKQTQMGLSSGAGAAPSRPLAPEVLVAPGAPHDAQLADALSDAAARAAEMTPEVVQPPSEAPSPPGEAQSAVEKRVTSGLASALAATAPRAVSPTIHDYAGDSPGGAAGPSAAGPSAAGPSAAGPSAAGPSAPSPSAQPAPAPSTASKGSIAPNPPGAGRGGTLLVEPAADARRSASAVPATPTDGAAASGKPGRSSAPPGAPVTARGSGPPAQRVASGALTLPGGANLRTASGTLPFGDLLDDIDDGFERIVQQPGETTGSPHTDDYREVKALFAQIAATHMGPVRDFMLELKLGEPPREWLELVLPAVRSLRTSAAGMGLDELGIPLDGFVAAIEGAATTAEARLGGEAREALIESYGGLARAMPLAFNLDEERDRREPIIVQSLLRQIPEVRKVALDKLYSAGLTSLSMYYVARAEDIAAATGLPRSIAEKIVERFSQHKQEIGSSRPDAGRSHEHGQLDLLASRLRVQNAAFDVASQGWSKQAAEDKRRLRNERNDTVLAANVLLARLGEIELVNRLERLPFAAKVDALDEYLQESKARLSRLPGTAEKHR